MGALHVLGPQQQQVLVGPRQHPAAQRGQHAQVVFRALLAKTDVDGDRVKTGGLVARELWQEGGVQRAQGQAGVVVPDGHGVDEPARG